MNREEAKKQQSVKESIANRISQLMEQIGNPEILDQKRIECKIEAYQEVEKILDYFMPDMKAIGKINEP